jgi:hypothetical protein
MDGGLNYPLGQACAVGNRTVAQLDTPPTAAGCLTPKEQIDQESRGGPIMSDEVGHQRFQNVFVDRRLSHWHLENCSNNYYSNDC